MSTDNILNNQDYDRVTTLQQFSKTIVENEIKRLDSKKTNMDSEVNNKNRMILLNRTYQERQSKFLVLMFIFLMILLCCLVIVFFQERLGYTSVMMDFLLILVIVLGGISAYFVYFDILRRDKIDFSKISDDGLIQPVDIINLTKLKTDVASGDLIPLSKKECVGAECCGPGYSYNSGICNAI